MDAFELGLCCYDEWEDSFHTEVINGESVQVQDTVAGSRWGLRYSECMVLEAAWQRRELQRLSERLQALESKSK